MLTTIAEILFWFNDDGNKLYVIEQALDLFKKYPYLYYAMRNILNKDTVLA